MSGRLVVFSGPPCAGKSTVAAGVAARGGYVHLQMDATRLRILPDSEHTRADRITAYRAMHFAAELLAGRGATVLLDATYGHPEDREEVARVAALTGAPFFLVECAVTVETALSRLARRGPDRLRVDLTPARVENLVKEFRYRRLGLLLDTEELRPEECITRVEAYLEAGRPTDPAPWL